MGDLQPKSTLIHRVFKNRDVKVASTEKCVIYGHTPVRYLANNDGIIFYPKEGVIEPACISDYSKIHIDTGVSLSGVLGCLCIEECKGIQKCK